MNLKLASFRPQTPYINNQSLNYAYAKINGLIISDIDQNGFIDLVTFPSAFEFATAYSPVVWGNQAGAFSYRPELFSINGLEVQYIRDSVAGDFNRDGYTDFFLVDQGWELNGRNPQFFFGHYPSFITGAADRIERQELQTWMEPVSLRKTFNHIGDAADFDGDGDLDLVIASFWELRLFENTGNGKFKWLRDAVPSVLNNDLTKTPSVSNGAPEPASGATFIKLKDSYAIAVGHYRSYSNDDPLGKRPPKILVEENGQFKVGFEVPKPNLGGREINYGAADMYNMDVNADGLEDLLILWEGEAVHGVDDGQSLILDSVYGGQSTRYADLSDNILTVYLQDSNGKLNLDSKYYQISGKGSGFHVYFDDLNKDGYIDFWNSSYGLAPKDFYKSIWLNNGTGGFANPASDSIKFQDSFESWYEATPLFIDANSDGVLDVVTLQPSFGSDYNVRNIGEHLRVYLNEEATNAERSLNYFSNNFSIHQSASGSLHIKGLGFDLTWFNVKTLKFKDLSVALDIDNHAGEVAKTLGAVFGKESVANKSFAGIGLHFVDDLNFSYPSLMELAINARLGANASSAQVVDLLYTNVVGQAPDAAARKTFTDLLDNGTFTLGGLGVLAADTELNKVNINLVGLAQTGLEYTPFNG
jgi:hypothetical protein